MLEISHLYKKYLNSERFAVEDLNLTLKEGEIFGFLGKNRRGQVHNHKVPYGYIPLQLGQHKDMRLRHSQRPD